VVLIPRCGFFVTGAIAANTTNNNPKKEDRLIRQKQRRKLTVRDQKLLKMSNVAAITAAFSRHLVAEVEIASILPSLPTTSFHNE
jgi:hypothetical protein